MIPIGQTGGAGAVAEVVASMLVSPVNITILLLVVDFLIGFLLLNIVIFIV